MDYAIEPRDFCHLLMSKVIVKYGLYMQICASLGRVSLCVLRAFLIKLLVLTI